jgi:hypothetical protein
VTPGSSPPLFSLSHDEQLDDAAAGLCPPVSQLGKFEVSGSPLLSLVGSDEPKTSALCS